MKREAVGGLQVSSEVGGWGQLLLHSIGYTSQDFIMALIIPALTQGLLHNCSACGSGSVFLCKGDSSHSPSFSIDVDLHYGAVCQQQHSMQTSSSLLEGTAQ